LIEKEEWMGCEKETLKLRAKIGIIINGLEEWIY